MRSLIMHSGYQPPPRAAVLLLSGLDSAAALHWALGRYAPVVALGIAYGQPVAELAASQAIAERRGVQWVRAILPEIGERRPDAGRDDAGVSHAFVPGRNGLFAWKAANVAARMFPRGRVAIVMGCNLDDSAGFPDCTPEFLKSLNDSIGMGLAGACDITIAAPWAPWLVPGAHKADIIRWASNHSPEALEDVRYAVSCYRGTRCGVCDACTLRARAFATAGVDDGSDAPPAEHGGDPDREARFSA